MDIFKEISSAKIGPAIETPIHNAFNISKKIKQNVLLKREDLQTTYSFKIRGSFNKATHIHEKNKSAIFLAASAGNHAQGVALAGKTMKHDTVIVIPETAPEIKINALKSYGAKVILHGENFDQAYTYAQKLSKENKYSYIHPYDDPLVIAGQGTIAMEIYRQVLQKIDSIFVPVGGGGLIAGISEAFAHLSPRTKIISVEASDSACLYEALQANKRIQLNHVGMFADGTAVKQVGKLPWSMVKNRVHRAVTVTTDEICSAIKILFEENRSMVEPAGAMSLAGLIKYNNLYQKKNNLTQVAIISGANLNFHKLRYISERTELGERSEIIISAIIPEKPGSFLNFAKIIGKRKITEFNYRYQSGSSAALFCGLQRDDTISKTIKSLREHAYHIEEFTDNEIAKTHIRYMIGGRSKIKERVFTFRFPEKPGAMLDFLKRISIFKLNISLFHYRNHGSDYGRVLCGLQGPVNVNKLKQAIAPITMNEVTDDSSYRSFLVDAE